MTAASGPVAAPDRGWRLPFTPSEGWLTIGLMVLLGLSLAWSLDGARLILGRDADTDFLPWISVLGVGAGVLGAKLGWGRWRTYLIGATAAALITPLIVGTVLAPEGASIATLYRTTGDAVVGAFEDLIVRNERTTPETGHHLWILGLLVWGTAMYAAYASFGHRRPLHGIVVVGLLLTGNIWLTLDNHIAYLIVFTLASLFLLMRFHTLEEQADWVRRRIGDPAAIGGLYLRGGTIFIVAAVIGALVLTTVASSAPLAGMWTNMNGRLIEWSRAFERFLPSSGNTPSLGPSFGSSAAIRGFWTSNDTPALTVRIAADDRDVPYWAAAVYDAYAMDRWDTSATRTVERDSAEDLLADTGDAVDSAARRPLTVTITPEAPTSIVFTPFAPSAVDLPVDVRLIGEDGYLASIERDASSDPYTITAQLAVMSDSVEGGVTANRLRVAGTDYPGEILELYTALPANALGPEATKVRAAIVARSASDAPYDIAEASVRYLQDSANFRYQVDVRSESSDAGCGTIGVVECFAIIRVGYCEYYASTMAVLLRSLGIPARLVEGYKGGEADVAAGVRRVKQSDAHAWVQVYFPRYGWVDFDPTGGGVAELAPIPSGQPEASLGPGPTITVRPRSDPPFGEDTARPDGGGLAGTNGSGGSLGPLVAVTLLLALVVGVLAATAWRRGPRGPVSADGAYGNLTSLAARLGFGPRPEQTVYEFVGTLAEALPASRPELETVARAKVEVAYGARVLGQDQLRGVREAQRRLRMRLLGLGVRRLRRRGTRR